MPDEQINLVLAVKEIGRVLKIMTDLEKRLNRLEEPKEINIKLSAASRRKFQEDLDKATFQDAKKLNAALRKEDRSKSQSPKGLERQYAQFQKIGLVNKQNLEYVKRERTARLRIIDDQIAFIQNSKKQNKESQARLGLLQRQKAEFSNLITAAKLLTREEEKRQQVEARAGVKRKQQPTFAKELGLTETTEASLEAKRKRLLKQFDKEHAIAKKSNSARIKMDYDLKRIRLSNSKLFLQDQIKNHAKVMKMANEIMAAWKKQGRGGNRAQAVVQAEKQLSKYGNTVKSTTSAEAKLGKQQLKMVRQHETLNRSLDVAIGKLIRYRIAFGAMLKLYQAFTGAIKIFIDVNHELAQIGKVIQPTQRELESIKNTAFELAAAYGQSIDQILKSFRVWGQVGLRQQDLQNAVNATLIAANALGIEATEVTESLTAAIFSYGVETQNLIPVIDKWMAVQRLYPITAQDLANGMKKVGIAAHNLGIDMDNLNGMLAAIVAVTRKSGREVGNSLKTMFARIPRSQTIKALQDIGVFMMKTGTDFRSLSDVLDDLSVRWKTLNDVQKTYIGQQVAGVRRYVDFIALMENYSVKVSATATSQAAFGEALEANEREMLTFKKQFDQVRASFEAFGEKFGTALAPILKDFVFLGKQFAKVFSNKIFATIIKSVTVLATTFLVAKAAIITKNFVMQKLAGTFRAIVPTVRSLTAGLVAEGVAIKVATAEAIKMNAAMLAMKRTNVIIAILSAAVMVFYLLRDAIGGTNANLSEFNQLSNSPEDIETLMRTLEGRKKQLEAFRTIRKEIVEYRTKLKGLNKESKEYIVTSEKIINRYQELARHSDDVGLAFERYVVGAKDAAIESITLANSISRLIEDQERLISLTDREFERKKSMFFLNRTPEEIKEEVDIQRKALDAIDAIWKTAAGNIDDTIRKLDIAELVNQAFSKAGDPTNVSSIMDEVNKILGDTLPKKPIDMSKIISFTSDLPPEEAKKIKEALEKTEKSAIDFRRNIRQGITAALLEPVAAAKTLPIHMREGFDETVKASKTFRERFVEQFDGASIAFNDLRNNVEPALDATSDRLTKTTLKLALFTHGIGDVITASGHFVINFDKISATVVNLQVGWKELTSTIVVGWNEAIDRQREFAGLQQNQFVTVNALNKAYATSFKAVQAHITRTTDTILKLKASQDNITENLESGFFKTTKQIDTANEKFEKQKDIIDILDRFLVALIIEAKEWQNVLGDGIARTADQLKRLKTQIRGVTFETQRQIALIKTRGQIFKSLVNDEVKGLQYQLLLIKTYRTEVEQILEDKKAEGREGEGLLETYKKQILNLERMEESLKTQILQARLLKSINPYKEFVKGFRETLGSGLGSLQGAWIKNTEERKKLQEDIYEKQIDLNEAISEGEKEAILEVRSELRELERDLEKINEIWRMIGESIRDAFLQLSDKVFQNAMNEIADEFTNMLFRAEALRGVAEGTDTLNLQVDAASAERVLERKKQEGLDLTYAEVQQAMEAFAGTGGEIEDAGDEAGNAIYRKMITAGSLVAGQIAGAIAGGGGPGAARGASLGTLGGQGVIAALGGTAVINSMLAFALPVIGGFIGGLIGGRDDDDLEHTATIRKNTDAVQANTNALEELSRMIINAPPRFRLPPIGGGLASGGVRIETLNVGGGASGASSFLDALEDYGIDLRTSRSRARIVI